VDFAGVGFGAGVDADEEATRAFAVVAIRVLAVWSILPVASVVAVFGIGGALSTTTYMGEDGGGMGTASTLRDGDGQTTCRDSL